MSYWRVIDLTHTLRPEFPGFDAGPQITVRPTANHADNGYLTNEWTLPEHTGTHLDAPAHFREGGLSAEQIRVEDLVVPLAVIDIRRKAASDPDAQLTAADILEWENLHGALPAGCCVAMWSGWDERIGSAAYRNEDARGILHFPGFHRDAAELLLTRQVVGIAVDTLSLDHGPSTSFDVHMLWLPANRWGLESVNNLGALPPRGSTIVVGAPKVAGASGGPARIIALLQPPDHH